MRVFLSKWFHRYAQREGIDDAQLCEAIAQAELGLVDANLGGGVFKQRIARKGEGKSGGYRAIILYRARKQTFFVFGFAKSDRSNISRDELAGFRRLAGLMLNLNEEQLKDGLESDQLREVICNEQDVQN